mmetsp:Transcript_52851/g.97799  ORF Transcript_52851/g.97799 Transcript_52851/m.97799 type:complete len:277 (+) Transcript_52851:81-911(+)
MLLRYARGISALVVAACVIHHGFADEGLNEDLDFEQDALTAKQMQAMHAQLDANGDGRVSMAETMAFADQMRLRIAKSDIQTILHEMDLDKDGRLSLDELFKDMDQWSEVDEKDDDAERKELEAEKFRAADVNQDGLLDESEMPHLFYPETHPKVLELTAAASLRIKDLDKDGQLTIEEFWEADAIDGEEMAISDEERADFAKLDLDGNGKLSLDELKAWESGVFHTEEAMRGLFEVADEDRDSHLTASELDKARERIAATDAQYHLMEWAEQSEL